MIADAIETIEWVREREPYWQFPDAGLPPEGGPMRTNPTLPPQSILNALSEPRRVQLHDPAVKTLLAEWKTLGHPIEYADLNQVAAILRVKNPSARTRRKIVAAVEAAGIEIHNDDGRRRRLAETGMHVRLSGASMVRIVEEMRWRWPEKWDKDRRRQRHTCVRVRRGRLELILERQKVKTGDEVLPWPDCRERWL